MGLRTKKLHLHGVVIWLFFIFAPSASGTTILQHECDFTTDTKSCSSWEPDSSFEHVQLPGSGTITRDTDFVSYNCVMSWVNEIWQTRCQDDKTCITSEPFSLSGYSVVCSLTHFLSSFVSHFLLWRNCCHSCPFLTNNVCNNSTDNDLNDYKISFFLWLKRNDQNVSGKSSSIPCKKFRWETWWNCVNSCLQ